MAQRKTPTDSVMVETEKYKRVLKHEGEVVLTLTLHTPRLPDTTPALRRMARYYSHTVYCWRKRWEGVLYRRACVELAALRERSLPLHPWEVSADFTVTYNERGLLSLFLDIYEYTGGAHGSTVRCGDVWDLSTGIPRTLPSFYPPNSRWRRQVTAAVHTEIERRLATGEYLFLDGWERAVVKEFDPCRFYLTEEGVTVFYPLYALAPYVEGIPTFLVVKQEPT